MSPIWYFSQILSLIASIIFLIAIQQKTVKKLFIYDTIQLVINVFVNLLLKGYSGAVVQSIAVLRGVLKAKSKLNYQSGILIITLQIIFGFLFNNHGIIGLLPIIASVSYSIVLMLSENILFIKLNLVINLILWTIYSFCIHDVIGSTTNMMYAFYVILIIIKQNLKK